eukprot:4110177-Pleurochrysis_carterae.AAC.3
MGPASGLFSLLHSLPICPLAVAAVFTIDFLQMRAPSNWSGLASKRQMFRAGVVARRGCNPHMCARVQLIEAYRIVAWSEGTLGLPQLSRSVSRFETVGVAMDIHAVFSGTVEIATNTLATTTPSAATQHALQETPCLQVEF